MKKSNWIIYNKKKIDEKIMQKFRLDPLTSVILCNRDINDEDKIRKILSEDLSDLNDEKLLPDVDKAVNILSQYIKEKKKIRIVGDYDIDGVCSTYILCDAIKNAGGDASFAIPDRVTDGYGINISIIDKAIADKIDLIVTCDNGISAGEQIAYAKENGIEVIVTDHHDIGELPHDALAIVNPKRKDVSVPYPFTEICGAVVAWKFMIRYYKLIKNDNSITEKYLEFAMLATIGDIMSLVDENHIITKLGLRKILNTKNKGLKKLLEVTGIDFAGKGINAYHIGFIIGPLINAAGRMDKATLALKLFLSNDETTIQDLADNLKTLNDERKQLTERGFKLATDEIESKYLNDKILVVFVKGLGEQVAGIVAGRIKDKYNRPTIVLTDTSLDDEAKASCRSIEAYDIFNGLSAHKDMFLKFGGHKLAAGFSIKKGDIDSLRKYLNDECNLTDGDFKKKVYIDAEYLYYCIDEAKIDGIERLSPFGQGFTRPTFATRGVFTKITNIYGIDKNVIKLNIEKDGKIAKGVIFVDASTFIEDSKKPLDIIYYPKINEFRGEKSVEFNVLEYR